MDMGNAGIAPRVTALHINASMKVPTFEPTELVWHILTALGRITELFFKLVQHGPF